eukprot:TRINITY_DN13676_c0_g1_i2.p1 TRINITY_DN13676_c0_g1~~TRINITY_DN13676_c0_g1_i2.p1  ORF type:complete len:1725 (+),score=503.82 TRINITY_DN13676_c0_g1_i2:93-5177(+)
MAAKRARSASPPRRPAPAAPRSDTDDDCTQLSLGEDGSEPPQLPAPGSAPSRIPEMNLFIDDPPAMPQSAGPHFGGARTLRPCTGPAGTAQGSEEMAEPYAASPARRGPPGRPVGAHAALYQGSQTQAPGSLSPADRTPARPPVGSPCGAPLRGAASPGAARTRPRPAPPAPDGGLFTTGSGAEVRVSGAELAKAQKRLGQNFGVEAHSPEAQAPPAAPDRSSAADCAGLFTTGSGAAVQVTGGELAKAQQRLGRGFGAEPGSEQPAAPQVEPAAAGGLFTTGSGAAVQVSSGEVARARMRLGQNFGMADAQPPEAPADAPQHQPAPAGLFTMGSGAAVQVSSGEAARARERLGQDFGVIDTPPPAAPPAEGLFTTGSGAAVSISAEDQARAVRRLGKAFFADGETTGGPEGAAAAQPPASVPQNLTAESAAASPEARVAAERRLGAAFCSPEDPPLHSRQHPSNPSTFSFTTGSGGAVAVSPEAREKAAKRLGADFGKEPDPQPLTPGPGTEMTAPAEARQRAALRPGKEIGTEHPIAAADPALRASSFSFTPGAGRGGPVGGAAVVSNGAPPAGSGAPRKTLHAEVRQPQQAPPPAPAPRRRVSQLHNPPPTQESQTEDGPESKRRKVSLHPSVKVAPPAEPPRTVLKRRGFRPPHLAQPQLGPHGAQPQQQEPPARPPAAAAPPAAALQDGPRELKLPRGLPTRHPQTRLAAAAGAWSREALQRPYPGPALAPGAAGAHELADPHRFPQSAISAPLARLLRAAGVSLAGGGVGAGELRKVLLHLGAAPAAVTEDWAANHLRWVVMKLSAMDHQYEPPGGPFLRPEIALAQLAHRYNVEYCKGRRSVLRLLYERDAGTQGRMLALKVARVGPKEGEVELTDGWYSIAGSLDAQLAAQAARGCIATGVVLLSYAPELTGSESAVAPLEGMRGGGRALRLSANCTRPARPAAEGGPRHLGWVCGPSGGPGVPRARLDSCVGDGGMLPCVEVVVQRRYPTVFAERMKTEKEGGEDDAKEGAGCTWTVRSEVAEDRVRERWAKTREGQLEGIRQRVAQEMGLDAPEAPPDPDANPGEMERLRQRAEQRRERMQVQFEARLREETDELPPERDVSATAELLLCDAAVSPSGGCGRATMRLYSSQFAALAALEEGMVARLYHLQPGKWQPAAGKSSASRILALRAGRGFFTRAVPYDQIPPSSAFVPRMAPALAALPAGLRYGEDFDFVGIVTSQQPAATVYAASGGQPGAEMRQQVLCLCDTTQNAILKVCAVSTATKEVSLSGEPLAGLALQNLHYCGCQRVPALSPGLPPLTMHLAVADERLQVLSVQRRLPPHLQRAADALAGGAHENASILSRRAAEVASGVAAPPATPHAPAAAPQQACPPRQPQSGTPPLQGGQQSGAAPPAPAAAGSRAAPAAAAGQLGAAALEARREFFSPPQQVPQAPAPPAPPPQQQHSGAPCVPALAETVLHLFGNMRPPYGFIVYLGSDEPCGVVTMSANGISVPLRHPPHRMQLAAGPAVGIRMQCTFDDGWSAGRLVRFGPWQLQQLLFPRAAPSREMAALLAPAGACGTCAAMRRQLFDTLYPMQQQQGGDETVLTRRFMHAVAFARLYDHDEEAELAIENPDVRQHRAPPGSAWCPFATDDWVRLQEVVLSRAQVFCKVTVSRPTTAAPDEPWTGLKLWSLCLQDARELFR